MDRDGKEIGTCESSVIAVVCPGRLVCHIYRLAHQKRADPLLTLRQGLDVPSLLRSKKIVYIDGLSLAPGSTATSRAGVDPPTLRLKSLGLDDIRNAVMAALGTVSTLPVTSVSSVSPPSRGPQAATLSSRIPPAALSTSTPTRALPANAKPVILLEGIDFLLASAPDVSVLALGSILATFRAQCHALVVIANADAPLLHTATSQDSGTPLERDHAHFLTSMAHQSRWVWQLRGLDTGSARDVTGVLRISRGGELNFEEEGIGAGVQPHSKGDHMPDAEWLYQVKGDGSVKIWSRGE